MYDQTDIDQPVLILGVEIEKRMRLRVVEDILKEGKVGEGTGARHAV